MQKNLFYAVQGLNIEYLAKKIFTDAVLEIYNHVNKEIGDVEPTKANRKLANAMFQDLMLGLDDSIEESMIHKLYGAIKEYEKKGDQEILKGAISDVISMIPNLSEQSKKGEILDETLESLEEQYKSAQAVLDEAIAKQQEITKAFHIPFAQRSEEIGEANKAVCEYTPKVKELKHLLGKKRIVDDFPVAKRYIDFKSEFEVLHAEFQESRVKTLASNEKFIGMVNDFPVSAEYEYVARSTLESTRQLINFTGHFMMLCGMDMGVFFRMKNDGYNPDELYGMEEKYIPFLEMLRNYLYELHKEGEFQDEIAFLMKIIDQKSQLNDLTKPLHEKYEALVNADPQVFDKPVDAKVSKEVPAVSSAATKKLPKDQEEIIKMYYNRKENGIESERVSWQNSASSSSRRDERGDIARLISGISNSIKMEDLGQTTQALIRAMQEDLPDSDRRASTTSGSWAGMVSGQHSGRGAGTPDREL